MAEPRRSTDGEALRGPGSVSDDEMAEIGRAIPLFMHAIKAVGPPAPALLQGLASGLGPRHINTLHVVATEGPMSVSALAARLEVALPTASLMVGELSRAGLIERTEDPDDRRRTIVGVAPHVEGAVRDFVERRLIPLRRALERLTPQERRGLVLGLRALGEEWSAAWSSPADCATLASHPSAEVAAPPP